jgi:hypothetical protein
MAVIRGTSARCEQSAIHLRIRFHYYSAMSDQRLSRRHFLGAAFAGAATFALGARELTAQAQQATKGRKTLPVGIPKQMVIYKDPNCGCCTEWVKHVQAAGFDTTVRDTTDMNSVKASLGVPAALHSCHTVKVGAYVLEGHVPADLVVRLLQEKKSDVRGLAVPGMPVGSPGMEMGGRKDKYDVVLFDKAGKTRVFASR